ncbi:pantoate--beta-alanine ligase [Novosphingobium sp. FSW06-99]|uniref:pantoate--beta-alanine ligase n=1 Tax=Novosphingobium sp. FSW06-99 TaxID=1739113 RepID=UPI0009E83451|nr:pantoate--beta-alanine ligase [Novosphingobium sp. FSW06-99]
MQTVSTRAELGKSVAMLKSGGKTLALVPTMGALHEGHLTLVRRARACADRVAVSIFVNPLQFGVNEDLDAYPRQLAQDQRLLRAAGVDLLWAPGVAEMYPDGFATTVSVQGLDRVLCGMHRPGHFDGVATVVLKLFNQVCPDVALFGEKDWQQLTIIRRMARDLDLAFPRAEAIIGVPTVREPDGLALSSRNRYLSQAERASATTLNRAMRVAVAAILAGDPVGPVLDQVRRTLLAAGFDRIDYADLRSAETLDDLAQWHGGAARLLVAAHIGRTRLIDNMAIEPAMAHMPEVA